MWGQLFQSKNYEANGILNIEEIFYITNNILLKCLIFMYNILVKENIYFKKKYAKNISLDLIVQYLWLILSNTEGYQWKQYGRIMNGTCIRQNQPDIEGLRMAICLWSWIILFSFLHMFNYFSMKEKEKVKLV